MPPAVADQVAEQTVGTNRLGPIRLICRLEIGPDGNVRTGTGDAFEPETLPMLIL